MRTDAISAAVARALGEVPDAQHDDKQSKTRLIANFFSLFGFDLSRYRLADFVRLRKQVWKTDEEEYAASFRDTTDQKQETRLTPVGDLGYSGSTFLMTSNGKYIVKSLDRSFEYRFFKNELSEGYLDHMTTHADSLLVRITDTLFVRGITLGGLLGLAPTHHIVMENLMHGKEREQDAASWETYDLKPDDYFFPERDIADGRLAPESVKSKLVHRMPDRLHVSAEKKRALVDVLQMDTEFLAGSNVVDYSLFLLRFPRPSLHEPSMENTDLNWRSGVVSVDGEFIYRALLLDFFWARHKLHPVVMSGLVCAFNFCAQKGPMTITADPWEYRGRFLDMVNKLVSGQGESSSSLAGG
jgi:hypothetical protein